MDPQGVETTDLHLHETARTLRVAVWLHRLDMFHDFGWVAHDSLNPDHHHEGPLLQFFLNCGNCLGTFKQVVAQTVWENETETREDLNKTREMLANARTSKRDLAQQYQKASDAYKASVHSMQNQKKVSKKRNKRDALSDWLKDAKWEVCDLRWKMIYNQAFLDKLPLAKLEEIRGQPSLTDSDSESDSSHSSHGDESESSSSQSEAKEATSTATAEEARINESAFQALGEVENVEMEVDPQDVAEPQSRPLSPTTTADNELLDQQDQDGSLPPTTPNRVTDGISHLHVDSPNREAENQPEGVDAWTEGDMLSQPALGTPKHHLWKDSIRVGTPPEWPKSTYLQGGGPVCAKKTEAG